MKRDLAAWCQGILEIEIKGGPAERLLDLAFQENVPLFDLHRENKVITAGVRLADIKKVRRLARRAHCLFHIRKRRGLPFIIAMMRKRPLLPVMAVLTLAAFIFISSLIFTLDVSGPYPVSAEDTARILALAKEAGVAPGRCRWQIDIDKAETYILHNFPELTFAEIEENGVHLVINVVKRTDVPEDQLIKPPGDLVAVCDGIIEDVLVRRGTAAVGSGDAVCAGDVLVYGYMGGQAVAADAIVTARLWGEGYGECSAAEEYPVFSGRTATSLGLRINEGPYVHLAGAVRPPYEECSTSETVYNCFDWRKCSLTVEILSKVYRELLPEYHTYSQREATDLARTRSAENAYCDLLRIFGRTPDGILQIVDSSTEDILLKDGLARARTVVEGLAEIGEYRYNEEYDRQISFPDEADELEIEH
ncbi:MAG: sporulation protein YqfD [Firmicutes bacterium]|nr:sporulation protein YqfD [Bacillota bacterium]